MHVCGWLTLVVRLQFGAFGVVLFFLFSWCPTLLLGEEATYSFSGEFPKSQPIKQHLSEMSSSYDEHHPCPILNASHSHPPALEAK